MVVTGTGGAWEGNGIVDVPMTRASVPKEMGVEAMVVAGARRVRDAPLGRRTAVGMIVSVVGVAIVWETRVKRRRGSSSRGGECMAVAEVILILMGDVRENSISSVFSCEEKWSCGPGLFHSFIESERCGAAEMLAPNRRMQLGNPNLLACIRKCWQRHGYTFQLLLITPNLTNKE